MPKHFSRVRASRKREEDSDRWMIGLDYIVLFFVVSLGAFFTMTTTYGLDSNLTTIALMQMVFALVGFVLFTFPNIYPTIRIRSGVPTKEDVRTMLLWFFILFPITLIMTAVFMVTLSNIIGPNMQIALTSAIVEEALFGAGIGTLFFYIWWYLFIRIFGKQVARLLSEILGALFTAGFFALLHIGAYGIVFSILFILFTNRFVYQMAFYRTRNLMLPTLMHLANNWLVYALSVILLSGG